MKYSELEREITELGFYVKHSGAYVVVTKDADFNTLAHISNREEYVFNTVFSDFRALSSVTQFELYSLIKQYAETSLKDRDDAERYVYEQPEALGTNGYLNIVDFGGENERVMFSTPSDTDMYRAQFTDKEVDELSLAYRQLIGICKKVNVKDLQN